MKRIASIIVLLTVALFGAAAQGVITVQGTVIDSGSQPLAGVVVLLKGSRGTAAQTDGSGAYSIRIPSGTQDAVLEFSCIGYSTVEETVAGRTQIDITLEEDQQLLDEVVVVGYGTQKKVNVIGSVSSINYGTLSEGRSIVSPSASLAGLAPGMSVMQGSGQPGSDGATIRIRGLGSFSTSSFSPLVLVDGVEWSLDNVNPNDIENISVLKDAATTAIYGTRGSNGVILITTKTGSEKNPQVTYSFKEIIQNPYSDLHFVSDYADYMELMNEASENMGTSKHFTQGNIDAWRAAKANPNGLNEFGVPNYVAYPNTDWFKEIFNTGYSQEHNLSVSGGSKRVKYLTSLGYLDNKGVMNRFDIDSSTKKFNFRANMEADVNDWITFGTRVFGQRQEYGLANISNAFNYLYQTTPGVYPGSPNAWGSPALADEESSNANNIFHQMYGSYGYNVTTRVNATAYAKLRPVKGLSIEGTFNYAPVFTEKHTYSTGKTGFWDYVHDVRKTSPNLEKASVSNNTSRNYRTTAELLARYGITLGQHELEALVGYSNQEYFAWGWGASKEGATEWSLNDLSTFAEMKSISSTAKHGWAQQSVFGRLNWAWMNKYLAEFDFRVDGSSKFGPNKRYGFFPSGSIGWKIHEESFMQSTRSWLDNLKLRLSYGVLGNNSGIGEYAWQATYETGNVVYNGMPTKGFYTYTMSNPNLAWEPTAVANIGIDSGFLKNRLTAEIDLYNRRTTNILYSPKVDDTMGFMGSVPANLGVLYNRGIEIALNWRDNIGKSFAYYAGVNFSYNKNMVTKFKGKLKKGWTNGEYHSNFADVAESSGAGYICEGHPMQEHYMRRVYHGNGKGYTGGAVDLGAGPKDGMIRTEEDMRWVQAMLQSGYTFCGNANARKNQFWYGDLIYEDRDGDGNYGDADDMDFNGHTSVPTTLLGINLGCSWKGIDFSMVWSGAFGFWLNWSTIYYNASQMTHGYGLLDTVAYDHYFFDPNNPDDPRTNIKGKYPRLTEGTSLSNRETSDFYEYKGDYLKLKTVQLGYTLPAKWTAKAAMKQLRVFVSGENLLTLTSYPGLDPEKGTSIGYPLMRQVTFGAQVTF